jgi:hypothetical protein
MNFPNTSSFDLIINGVYLEKRETSLMKGSPKRIGGHRATNVTLNQLKRLRRSSRFVLTKGILLMFP